MLSALCHSSVSLRQLMLLILLSANANQSPCGAHDHPDDCTALSALQKATGAPWPLDGSTLCEWEGVKCDSSGRVSDIDMYDVEPALEGALPTQVGLLTAMSGYFGFDGNVLSGSVPTQIGRMTSLTRGLGLGGNAFSGAAALAMAGGGTPGGGPDGGGGPAVGGALVGAVHCTSCVTVFQ